MGEAHLTDQQYVRILQARMMAPDDRMNELWAVYEESTGRTIGRPPSRAQRELVSKWMLDVELSGPQEGISIGPPWRYRQNSLRQSVFRNPSNKQSALANFACAGCEPIVRPDGTSELAISMPLNLDPWSRQSTPGHAVIRDALREALQDKSWLEVYKGEALCVRVSSLIGSDRKRH